MDGNNQGRTWPRCAAANASVAPATKNASLLHSHASYVARSRHLRCLRRARLSRPVCSCTHCHVVRTLKHDCDAASTDRCTAACESQILLASSAPAGTALVCLQRLPHRSRFGAAAASCPTCSGVAPALAVLPSRCTQGKHAADASDAAHIVEPGNACGTSSLELLGGGKAGMTARPEGSALEFAPDDCIAAASKHDPQATSLADDGWSPADHTDRA